MGRQSGVMAPLVPLFPSPIYREQAYHDDISTLVITAQSLLGTSKTKYNLLCYKKLPQMESYH